jgi:hypothetical protein
MPLSRRTLISLSFIPLFGCASTPTSEAVMQRLTPGLANVQWLGQLNYTQDQPIPDVVSNGLEACGRGADHQWLPNQWPPCPKPSTPPIAGQQLLPTSDAEASARLVQPWEEVTLFPWPCTPAGRGGEKGTGVECR